MRLPATSAALLFAMEPSRKNVIFNQFVYPALKAQSVRNAASALPMIQGTAASQPTWKTNAITSTYANRNFPGLNSGGRPGLVFGGSQLMEYPNIANTLSGTEVPFAVVTQIQCLSSGGTIFCLGSASTSKVTLSYSGGNITATEVNGNGTFTATSALSTSAHVISVVRTASAITLRVDGAQVATGALTSGSTTYTQFAVGASHTNGTTGSQFNGSIARLNVYKGSPVSDILGIETFMLEDAGIIRGPTSHTNSGF